jgi:hypothetical protein
LQRPAAAASRHTRRPHLLEGVRQLHVHPGVVIAHSLLPTRTQGPKHTLLRAAAAARVVVVSSAVKWIEEVLARKEGRCDVGCGWQRALLRVLRVLRVLWRLGSWRR